MKPPKLLEAAGIIKTKLGCSAGKLYSQRQTSLDRRAPGFIKSRFCWTPFYRYLPSLFRSVVARARLRIRWQWNGDLAIESTDRADWTPIIQIS
jgi:hypothetical protein